MTLLPVLFSALSDLGRRSFCVPDQTGPLFSKLVLVVCPTQEQTVPERNDGKSEGGWALESGLWKTRGPVTASENYTAQTDSLGWSSLPELPLPQSRWLLANFRNILRPEVNSEEQILELLAVPDHPARDTECQIKKHHLQSIEEAVALVYHLQKVNLHKWEMGEKKNSW